MDNVKIKDKIAKRMNAYRSILYALEAEQLGFVTLDDINNFIDYPIELKELIKGKTRVELIAKAKELKIANYGRKNITQLNQEIVEHEYGSKCEHEE